ncbi:MAG: DNA repair nucleotidyltransferase [Gammaproteobacteria bacterium]|nr:MAG: DNA repair nucleotidyltransferase [Gammaproteobacteria bacterium]
MSRSAVQLDLPFDPPARPRPCLPRPATAAAPRPAARRRLWLAVYVADLPLAALPAAPGPQAVTEGEGQAARLAAVDETARRHGVREGMGLTAALLRCPALRHRPRSPEAEAALLARLADRAYRFSDTVALAERGVVLEIGGSLRLFGGRTALLRRWTAALAALGLDGRWAAAPTRPAAWWLARWRPGLWLEALEGLRAALRDLPIEALEPAPRERLRLRAAGLRRLGELWRLPPDALARRYGRALLERLDAALYDAPAPPLYRPPAVFRERCAFEPEVNRWTQIAPALDALAGRLAAFLEQRVLAVEALAWRLETDRGRREGLLHFARPCREARRIARRLRDALQAAGAHGAVRAVELETTSCRPATAVAASLFEGAATAGESWAALCERLRDRFGPQALVTARLRADWRPERALQPSTVGAAALPALPPRPLWLLDPPRPAREPAQWRLEEEVERIEQGWWDGRPVRRDYRWARTPDGRRLWVFRDRRDGRWWVQGVDG